MNTVGAASVALFVVFSSVQVFFCCDSTGRVPTALYGVQVNWVAKW